MKAKLDGNRGRTGESTQWAVFPLGAFVLVVVMIMVVPVRGEKGAERAVA